MARVPETWTHSYTEDDMQIEMTLVLDREKSSEFSISYRVASVEVTPASFDPRAEEWRTCSYEYGDACQNYIFDEDGDRCWDHEADEEGVTRSECACEHPVDGLDDYFICSAHSQARRARAAAEALKRWVDPSPGSLLT